MLLFVIVFLTFHQLFHSFYLLSALSLYSKSLYIYIYIYIYIMSFLIHLTRVGCLRVISPSFLCWEFLACRLLFYKTRFLALCSTPTTLEDLGFSIRVISLRWFVPIIMLGTRVPPFHDLAVQPRFQGSWRGHACVGLGRNKWHFSGFNGTHTHTHQQGMYPWDHVLPLWPLPLHVHSL